MKKIPNEFFIFVGGLGIGAVAGYFLRGYLTKKKVRKQIDEVNKFLDEKVEEHNSSKNEEEPKEDEKSEEKKLEKPEETKEGSEETYEDLKEQVLEEIESDPSQAYRIVMDEDEPYYEYYEEDPETGPYIINEEWYEDPKYEGFNKEELILYTDGVLVNRETEIRTDADESIGQQALDWFLRHPDYGYLYVRNELNNTDYKVYLEQDEIYEGWE